MKYQVYFRGRNEDYVPLTWEKFGTVKSSLQEALEEIRIYKTANLYYNWKIVNFSSERLSEQPIEKKSIKKPLVDNTDYY